MAATDEASFRAKLRAIILETKSLDYLTNILNAGPKKNNNWRWAVEFAAEHGYGKAPQALDLSSQTAVFVALAPSPINDPAHWAQHAIQTVQTPQLPPPTRVETTRPPPPLTTAAPTPQRVVEQQQLAETETRLPPCRPTPAVTSAAPRFDDDDDAPHDATRDATSGDPASGVTAGG